VGALQDPDRLLSDLLRSLLWQNTHCSLHPTQDVLHRKDRFAELLYDPLDGGNTFLRNVGYHSMHYTASYPRRRYSAVLLFCRKQEEDSSNINKHIIL
jgi:hypothetical protein